MKTTKRKRVFFFFLTIAIGIGAGLAFGWLLMPPQAPSRASLSELRADYKTDLVLMVAEEYHSTRNASKALDQLAKIDAQDPLGLLVNAINYAGQIGYAEEDLKSMQALFQGIDAGTYQTWLEERGN